MKDWVRDRAKAIVKSQAWTTTSRWIRGGTRKPGAGHEIDGIEVPAEIVAYFGDKADKIYQLTQWLPVLEELNRHHRVLLVFRKVDALRAVKGMTKLPKVFVRRFDDLATLYFDNDYRLILYVNNGVTNFQSLSYAPAVHVHVNHGESDKLSMVSNQAKAYDRTFVAGEAAIQRHRAALLDFDMSKLLTVGRPQLDVDRQPALSRSPKKTLMYAPTWEGENDSNNYTSIDLYGVQIIEALLAVPNARVVYKPHPRVETTANTELAAADALIRERIETANLHGGQHLIEMQGDILAMFSETDLLVTDISSVGLDFLYLRSTKPLILTDRRTNREALNSEAPVSRATPIIDKTTVKEAMQIIESSITEDSYREQRREMRNYYFGDRKIGDSTADFLAAVDQLMTQRNSALVAYARQEGSNMEASD